MNHVQTELFAMRDDAYKAFQCRLIPTVDPDTVIGVRTPALRAFAKRLGPENVQQVFSSLPHRFYDENNLHAVLIGRIADYDDCIREVERFLPFVDNWATCDMMRPPVFKTHKAQLLERCRQWLRSDHPYTVRFALEMLMLHGLEDAFDPLFLQFAVSACCEHYYVNMMVAWFFATALAFRYDETVAVLKENVLPIWVHNKAIQKALESRRIADAEKACLKMCKR